MNNNTKKISATGAILVSMLGLAMLSSKSWSQAAPPAAAKSTSGRYQMLVSSESTNPSVFLLDTQTGRFWVKESPQSSWQESTPNFSAPVRVDQEAPEAN